MCLINFHVKNHATYDLIVVANRDEFYNRPTAAASFWEDHPNILAGRDLLQCGTWLGITKEGRFAALTNFRDPKRAHGRISRGDIVRDYLSTNVTTQDFIHTLAKTREDYGGYNILIGDVNGLVHYNNIFDEVNVVPVGTHSLSNSTLNTPWPKVVKGRNRLQQYVQTNVHNVQLEPLFSIVADEETASDEDLPKTGVSLEWERVLSPMFIKSPHYGTRASTILLIDKERNVTFVERTFLNGTFHTERRFDFKIGQA